MSVLTLSARRVSQVQFLVVVVDTRGPAEMTPVRASPSLSMHTPVSASLILGDTAEYVVADEFEPVMAENLASTRDEADIGELSETPRVSEFPPSLELSVMDPFVTLTSQTFVSPAVKTLRVQSSLSGLKFHDRIRGSKRRVSCYPSRLHRKSPRTRMTRKTTASIYIVCTVGIDVRVVGLGVVVDIVACAVRRSRMALMMVLMKTVAEVVVVRVAAFKVSFGLKLCSTGS